VNDKQKHAFEDLREEMASPEFIVPYRAGSRKRLVTDASSVECGSVTLLSLVFSTIEMLVTLVETTA
jgi:hypothetical protein